MGGRQERWSDVKEKERRKIFIWGEGGGCSLILVAFSYFLNNFILDQVKNVMDRDLTFDKLIKYRLSVQECSKLFLNKVFSFLFQ